MTWSYVGQYNPNVLNAFESKIQYQDKLYLVEGNITEINFAQKTATKYSFKTYEEIKKHFVIGDTIYGIFANSQNKYYFKKTTIAHLRGAFIETIPFLVEPNTIPINYPTMGLIGVTLLGLVVVGYKKRIIPFQKHSKGIVYDSQKDQFLHKRKNITLFEENEKKILHFLLANSDQFVSLNQLNGLFENPAQPETQSAIFKRREQAINGLLIKVSKLTGIPEEELLLERKNLEDKRLKDLLLLPKLLEKA